MRVTDKYLAALKPEALVSGEILNQNLHFLFFLVTEGEMIVVLEQGFTTCGSELSLQWPPAMDKI